MPSGKPLEESQVADLYAKFAPELERFAWGIVRDWSSASDVVQVAFWTLAQQGGGTAPEARKSWLYKVTLREALRLRASSQRRDNREASLVEPISNRRDPKHNPPDQMELAEEAARMRKRVAKLPKEQRQVMELRIEEEKTFQEISDLLQIPLGTALSRMRLALEKIRESESTDE